MSLLPPLHRGVLTAVVLLPASVPAQTVVAAHDPPAQRINVTSGRPSSLPLEIPTTTESISGAEIERSINATDSEDALKYFPSLLVRKRYVGDYDHAVLSTRASGTGNSARSLVYADGILLSNLLGNGAFFTPRWGLVTPEEIERVDVLYGPFSAAYSGNSVGAVVDYVTRMPRQFEAHAKVSGFGQHFELYNTDDRYTGGQASASIGNAHGAWSWWVDLNRLDSEGQPLVFATRIPTLATAGTAGTPVTGWIGEKNRFNQDWYLLGTSSQAHTVQDHAKLKLAYRFSSDVRASYTFGLWHNETTRRYASYLRGPDGNTVLSGTVNIEGNVFALTPGDFPQTREDLEHRIHGLSIKRSSGTTWDWELAASLYDYAKDRVRVPTVSPPAADTGGAGRITDMAGTGWNTAAAKGIWRPQAPHVVEFGLQRDAYQLRNRVSDTPDWISGEAVQQASRFEGCTELASVWGQDAWRITPDWKAVLGLRAEHWTASDGVTANAASAFQHPSRSDTFYSPKAAVGWDLDDEWTLKLSTGRAVRMPTVSELYQGGLTPTGQLQNGDPNLKPERSQTTELGAEWARGAGHLRATLFHEDTKDALYAQTNTSVLPNVTNVQNVDHIRTTGVELAAQASDVLLRGLELLASITYADSTIEQNDKFSASVGKQQPRVPHWRASLLATWHASEQLSSTLGLRYGSKQFNTLDNSDPNGARYQGVSDFFVVDVRLRYRWNVQWSAALGIDNLNNATYWNFHPYPQRTAVAELRFDI